MAQFTDSRLANMAAQAIHDAFDNYHTEFKFRTRQARLLFEARDWHKGQQNARARLDLYRHVIDEVEKSIRTILADRVQSTAVWAGAKAVFSGLIIARDDWEQAETFFNSVTRRIFTTVGVDEQIEFVATDFDTPPTPARQPIYRTFTQAPSTVELFLNILEAFVLDAPYEDLQRDAQLAAEAVEKHLREIGALRFVSRVEMVRSIFFRGKGAYIVGRMFSASHLIPLALAMLNTPQGIVVDAVLLDENDLSLLFSFTRSYFQVEVERPYDLVHFLKSIIPRKRDAELYISIGYNKHGKTELYRDLLQHLATSNDKFERARGEKGMVMMVFAMPGYDVVFKIIKDRFAYPKKNTRKDVMEKYKLVFRHDRAGRLVDAQEFEFLEFDRSRFEPDLLEELQAVAASTVQIGEEHVIIRHCYVERAIIPLNIYLSEAPEEAAVAAAIDYGNAIKDMAVSNIFPGDMLLKNFGVTRHGRVIFYDYDELCLLETCNFRKMPQSAYYEDELAPEPWFTVAENDYFPEEFEHFMGLPMPLHEEFRAYHADLFDVHYWHSVQARLKAGEVIDIFPYATHQRLHCDR
ncbi:MAG: bifunctional isocitrate dehydrogenase kinase/phosphatase [Ardenticatenaceae bacterium]|nr:bifunctional isocitrate dehydrogenase kinase/phosphatase [Ardenticatenaceae bacterium]